MCPNFIKRFVKIQDTFFLEQNRKNDNSIAQIITYRIKYNTISIYVSVVYTLPDISPNKL